MKEYKLQELVKLCSNFFPKKWDEDFFKRTWANKPEANRKRLMELGFSNLDHVLDAGCGYGHWTFMLGELNKKVTGIEFEKYRCNAAKELRDYFGYKNVQIDQGSMTNTTYKNELFDGVFTFYAIECTEYRKSLKEIYRVLKPGGLFYLNAADLGWYIYNILTPHNPSADFSPRKWAIESIKASLEYYNTGKFNRTHLAENIVIPKELIITELKELGFEILISGNNGANALKGKSTWHVIHPEKQYNHWSVYEIICKKKLN